MRGTSEDLSSDPARPGRSAALDGLRGVAILLVVGDHVQVPGMDGLGAVGVALFFVLSGYLITRILLDRPRLSRFYLRRAARVIPGAAFMLAIFASVATLLTGDMRHAEAAGFSLLYVANWAQILGFPMSSLSAMWSLAVEEQFYLLWPVVLAVTPRRRLPAVLVSIVVGSLLLRFSVGGAHAYQGTDTNAYALALGGLAACASIRPGGRWAGSAVIAVLGVCAFVNNGLLAGTLAAMLATIIVGEPPAWLGNRLLSHLGTVSFGWYLWHVPVYAFASAFTATWTRSVIAGVASLGLAQLSWMLVERPVLGMTRPSVQPNEVIRKVDVPQEAPGTVR